MDADALVKEGDSLLENKQFKEAIRLFTKAIVSAPRNAPAYCRRAEAYYDLLKHSAARPPHDADKYAEFEIAFRGRQELKLALRDLNVALKLSPDYANAHFGKGVIEYEKGLYRDAVRSFSKTISLGGKVVDSYYGRAMAYEQLKDDARALADLDAIIELDSKYADAYLERGVILSTQDKYAEALREIDKAISLSPDTASYFNHRAMAIAMPAYDTMDTAALEKARDNLSEAIRLDPEFAEAYFNRSFLDGILDDYAAELEDLATAIRLDPNYTAAYLQRFQCLAQMGKMDSAAEDWAQYCSRSKERKRVMMPEGFNPHRLSN